MKAFENLRDFYLFRHLTDAQFEKLKAISTVHHYTKGTILFFEGDAAKHLILLVEGILQVYKTDQKGNKIILHHFFPIDMIAEMANLEHVRYPASAEFESDGTAVMIHYETFEKEFLKDPDICFAFIRSLSKKIKYLENVIATNLVMNSTARVAKFLCEHGHKISSLKKSMIAADLNMTPETLSRILKKFSILHLIEKRKDEIIILDRDGLETFYL